MDSWLGDWSRIYGSDDLREDLAILNDLAPCPFFLFRSSCCWSTSLLHFSSLTPGRLHPVVAKELYWLRERRFRFKCESEAAREQLRHPAAGPRRGGSFQPLN